MSIEDIGAEPYALASSGASISTGAKKKTGATQQPNGEDAFLGFAMASLRNKKGFSRQRHAGPHVHEETDEEEGITNNNNTVHPPLHLIEEVGPIPAAFSSPPTRTHS
jgi:hypothetical protein